MSNASSIQLRLSALADSLREIQQLISRLAKSGPQDESSIADTPIGRLELTEEIHSDLNEQEEDFELLVQDAQYYSDDITTSDRRGPPGSGSLGIDLATRIAKHREDLKLARVQFRKAQLIAQRNAEAAQRKERDLLFAGLQEEQGAPSSGYGRRKAQEKLSQDELALNASSDLTASIRHLHGFMSAELERSQFARETLENSTKDLSGLSESYNNLEGLLSSSRSLVSTLISSQKSDTWYLESAFYLLIGTLIWLAFRRLLYGPLWWILYLPVRSLLRLFTPLISFIFGVSFSALTTAQSPSQVQKFESASGKADIPTFIPGMPENSIRAGGGGQGAKAETINPESESMTEKVEKMMATDQGDSKQTQSEETVLRERRPDELPNPKKRVWEEPPVSAEASAKSKDEL